MLHDLTTFVQEHRPHGQLIGDASEPGPSGYRVTVACSCGVTFERWVTELDVGGPRQGTMHIFIDESGTFVPSPSDPSISAVGALTIPDSLLSGLERRYAKLRPDLPTNRGEVKGRLLSESQVDEVVSLLARHQVVFESTAIDTSIHNTATVAAHKSRQAHLLTANLTDRHHPNVRKRFAQLRSRLDAMSDQLYLQSVATFALIETVLRHDPLFYAQRHPGARTSPSHPALR